VQLNDIRGDLIRQEETIIFALIERSQFARNAVVYKHGESEVLHRRGVDRMIKDGRARGASVDAKLDARWSQLSFMEYFLVETESMHAKLGRYNSPDENAFFSSLLPRSVVGGEAKPSALKPNLININNEVLAVYTDKIVTQLCANSGEDDGEYGSTCACDVAVLQALSKRIHYGKFVAEAKFQAERERFTKMILANDALGIMAALTSVPVEDAVVERVRTKASRYGTDGGEASYKVEPDVIAKLYRDYLIPLNKNVQVAYLLQRLERPSYAFVAEGQAEGAARAHFGGPGLACATVEDVFLAVSRNHVAYGVVPIQDSVRGLHKGTQRALLDTELAVCASLLHEPPGAGDEWTRFYCIATKHLPVSGATTKLVAFFGVRHAPGSLVAALTALDGVNLSSLESIPIHNKDYAFFCEIEGRMLDEPTINGVLDKMASVTTFVKLVGHY
jgi:chorismate mutase